ncbi:MAG: S8 family serine peptidase [Saprospiraceae bacterium]
MKTVWTILLSFSVFCISAQRQTTFQAHNGSHLEAQMPISIKQFVLSELINNQYYRLVKSDHLISESEKLNLAKQGIEILEYIPNFYYLVSIRKDATTIESDNPVFSMVYEINSNIKLAENLLFGQTCFQEHGKNKIVLKYFKNIDQIFILEALRGASLTSERFFPSNQIVYLSLTNAEIQRLATMPWVQFMDCESAPGIPEDREGQSLHRVNLVKSNIKEGINLSGKGVKVMVRDDGSVGPHIDFQGRIQQDILNEIGDHGDGVAGILTGAGNYDPIVEGMAPGADLYVINYQPDFLDKTLSYHQNDGVVVTNSSYSNGCNVGYTIEAQVVDKQIYENPTLLHVFSAGNSNGADCGYGAGNQWGNVTGGHKIGKNVLTVANLDLEGKLEISSSRGPAKDGRMKPEIAARGTNELSTAPGNGTLVFGGTSAAAPGVAGVCALLYEAYKNKHNDQNPESALIKATIMNTATDIGSPGPDYQFGFGVIDAYRAYKLINDQRYQKQTINHGQEQEYTINIPVGSPLAKIMIYWAEPEASLLSKKALINDLDLEVIDPTGSILKTWALDPTPDQTSLAAGASKGIDTLNNVEQVSISYPIAGAYKVKIKGKFLPSNSVSFYLLYEIEDKILRLSYPIGGEKFNITELSQVHYTSYGADSVQINFSTDAGKTWNTLATQAPESRLKTIYIPNNLNSDSCLIELVQGNLTERSGYFTITNGVQAFRISKYCPNEIELSWNGSTKDSFLIYQLGAKYMAAIGSTNQTAIRLPNEDPRIKKWFSIAAYEKTALSRREYAISTPDTLVGCAFTRDLGIALSSKSKTDYLSCNDLFVKPIFYIINRTNKILSGFTIKAQSKSGIVSQQFTESVEAFDTTSVEFSNGIVVENFGVKVLTAWLDFNQDQNPYNDTVFIPIQILELPEKLGTYPMIENFGNSSIPSNWIQRNELDNSKWSIANVKGKNGFNGNVAYFTNQNTNFRTQSIQLISKTADLTNAVEPYLYFDFAHHNFAGSSFLDSIRIRVKQVCGNDFKETTFLSGASFELKTVDTTRNQNWLPTDSSWYWLAYNLSAFKGTKVVVEFEIVRGLNNRTFLDNVEIRERLPLTANADFNISPNPGCYAKQITFNDSSDINGTQYIWDLDAGGNPRTFFGKGPFTCRYTISGKKRVVLKVKSETNNDAIIIKELPLSVAASAGYSFNIVSGRMVAFKNTSVNGDRYLWDFGDGTNSTEFSPVHTFDSAKIYKVKLSVINPCGTYSRTVNVDLTLTASDDLISNNNILIFPNPVKDLLILKSEELITLYRILSSDGKILHEIRNSNSKEIQIPMQKMQPGIYTIQVLTKNYSSIQKIEKI